MAPPPAPAAVRHRRDAASAVAAVALLFAHSGCSTRPPAAARSHDAAAAPATAAAVPVGFDLAADGLDAWNAVGQLVVGSADIRLEGRAQMLHLHAVRFRGEGLLVLTRALPLSATVVVPTTRVAVMAEDGGVNASPAAIALVARLRQALPAEIARVRARQAVPPPAPARAAPRARR